MSDLHAKAGLTAEAFGRLLAWFHPDRQEAAERYEIMRLKLIEWFEHQGCGSADVFADVVLDRVAACLADGKAVRSGAFFMGVARMVLLETFSRPGALSLSNGLDPPDSQTPEKVLIEGEEAAAARREVLDMVRCLREMPPDDLRLICAYHRADARGRRQNLATRLGLTTSALYIRMHRLRKSLAERLEHLRSVSDGR